MSLRLSLLFLFCTSHSAWAVSSGKHISQYAHSAWRIQDGAFAGAPNVISQTTDGYIWIGTESGLVRFDGVRFVPWTAPEGKRLQGAIYSLLPGRDGSLWVGTEANLARVSGGDLANFTDAPGRINSIIEDGRGTIWFSRSRVPDKKGPVCSVDATKLRCYGAAEGIPFPYSGPMACDSQGSLWIGSDTLLRWKKGSSTTYGISLKQGQGLGGVMALAVGPDESVWAGLRSSGTGLGLQRLVQGEWAPFRSEKLNTESLEVAALLWDREGSLWVGTSNQGIYRIHGEQVERFSSIDGLSSDAISNFFEDREGNLWVSTSEGIDCFRDLAVMTFSTREGLRANLVNSVLATRDGTVWIGNHGALGSLRDGKVSPIQVGHGLPGERVTSLLEDHSGRLWVGVDNGLYLYDSGRFDAVTNSDGGRIGTIVAITEDRANDVWAEAIGIPRKLIHIRNDRVLEEIATQQIPATMYLAADPNEGIWLTQKNGLARYRNGKLENFPFTHAARPNQVLTKADGSVLAATSDGLAVLRDNSVRFLTVQNGLPCARIDSFAFETNGSLWLYTECGLVMITSAELQKWWEDTNVLLSLKTLDVFDGARPGAAAFEPKASRSPDGRLWFANENVVQMIDPAHLVKNTLPPPVHVERIVADRKEYGIKPGLRLPPLTRSLQIDYTALSFVLPQKVRFRYKLDGQDKDWQEPGTRRQAFYNDLRPRKYQFHVIACNNDGVWNDIGATLDFSVAPAWYQTNWFLLLCVLTGTLLVWALYRVRVRQIARIIGVRFDERLAERTRMARELHDTFLQTIQGSKLVAEHALKSSDDHVRMVGAMEQLADWLGRATEDGRAALNSLRTSTTQRNDLADALRRATEECRTQSPMEVSFSVVGDAKEMHPVVRDEVYRIAYEAIRNACAHSRARRLDVALTYAQDLSLRVSDDGVGIDPSIADRGRDGHFGLQGMRERADRIGGKLTVVSSADSGTEITVLVPAAIVFKNSNTSPFERVRSVLKRMSGTPNSH